jgi:hypothetical protein
MTGILGDILWRLAKLLPVNTRERLDSGRREFGCRAGLLFVPEVLTLMHRPEVH